MERGNENDWEGRDFFTRGRRETDLTLHSTSFKSFSEENGNANEREGEAKARQEESLPGTQEVCGSTGIELHNPKEEGKNLIEKTKKE